MVGDIIGDVMVGDYHDRDNDGNDCAGGKCHGEQRGAARRVESPTNGCALIQTNALGFQI